MSGASEPSSDGSPLLHRRTVLAGLAAITASACAPRPAGTAASLRPQRPVGYRYTDDLGYRIMHAGPGRYTRADRPRDGIDIRYIVIHDTEQYYEQTLGWFCSPSTGATTHATTHYVIRSVDGQIVQMLPPADIAFHTGNFWFNMHSIGIEHEGFMDDGYRWYSEAMYRSSAKLVRQLAARYGIPLDRDHIIGHEEIPAEKPAGTIRQHVDPGPFWDWGHYFDLLGAPLHGAPPAPPAERMVIAVAPRFAENYHTFKGSYSDDDYLGRRTSNVVYLYSEPDESAPLLTDPALHPHRAPGTIGTADWSARAMSGQRFVLAERLGHWTAIWFGGRLGWFPDPDARIARPVPGRVITARPGRLSIPVYGAAYPRRGAFPAPLQPDDIVPLQYRIPAGQYYVAVARHSCDDYQGSPARPDDRVHVTDDRELYEISFNHRRAFVEAEDVHPVC